MNTPEYQFLTPAVKDFPDEPIKKPKGSNKKIEHKIVTVQFTPNNAPTALPRKAATMASKEETP